MCGITGIYAFTPAGEQWLERIEQANASIIHRGPDYNQSMQIHPVALGHCRLSIIDTSSAANQPFSDPSGRYHIILNGEIFNYREIKSDLLALGYEFRSGSDTEVLLLAWIHFGKDILQRIRGFFALAIFDNEEKSLVLVRDRLGVKPVYLYQTGDVVVFASEMKALIASGIPRKINPVSLYRYFALNYIPGQESIYENVSRMKPGTWIRMSAKGIETESYYQIPSAKESHTLLKDYESACQQLEQTLDEAVRLRMIADVPLGAFLSGGIDSSIITALASRHTQQLQTFSIGFKDEPMFDETRYAEMVARKYNTGHTSFNLTTDDLYDCLFQMLDSIDEPFADSSALAVYILSMHTRGQVTVALSGDGADEMFAGYNKHRAEYRIQHPGLMEKLAGLGAPLWKHLPQSRNHPLTNRFRQLHRFANAMKQNPADRYCDLCSISTHAEVTDLLLALPLPQRETMFRDFTHAFSSHQPLEATLLSDMHMVLPDDMLVKVDRMSMAHALEVRNPFLDHHVVNLAFSMPMNWKIDASTQKKILKDTFLPLLPQEILSRPKHGFEVPLLRWFKGPLKEKIETLWLNEDFITQQALFNPLAIKKLKTKLHSSSPGDAAARTWALIVFQNWWIKYNS